MRYSAAMRNLLIVSLVASLPTLTTACSSDSNGGGNGGSGATAGSGASAGSGGSSGSGGSAGSGATSGTGGASGSGGGGGSAGSPSGGKCEKVCQKLETAKCPKQDDLQTCIKECESNAIPKCIKEFESIGDCILGASTLSCDADGDVDLLSICGKEFGAWTACSACEPVGTDDACDACSKKSCCAERTALFTDPNVVPFIQCLQKCSDATCTSTCQSNHPKVATFFTALSSCQGSKCTSDCTNN